MQIHWKEKVNGSSSKWVRHEFWLNDRLRWSSLQLSLRKNLSRLLAMRRAELFAVSSLFLANSVNENACLSFSPNSRFFHARMHVFWSREKRKVTSFISSFLYHKHAATFLDFSHSHSIHPFLSALVFFIFYVFFSTWLVLSKSRKSLTCDSVFFIFSFIWFIIFLF